MPANVKSVKTVEPVKAPPVQSNGLAADVEGIVAETAVFDVHTHQYPPSFKTLFSAGIDDLVTYHYLVAELFRSSGISTDSFWAMTKPQQADLIWETLFVRNTPISEACRGVVCVMDAYGLDPHARSLKDAREFFSAITPADHVEKAMQLAGVTDMVMTNDVFDSRELEYWETNAQPHPKLHAALRLDALLNRWAEAHQLLSSQGYAASSKLDVAGIQSARRFLDAWIERMNPVYMAVSLPPAFRYPEDSPRGRLIKEVVLPAGREHNLPFSMMMGARKAVNPALKDAGDSVGYADTQSVERICLENPENRFLVSMLSRENQHELCVAARKFANLMPFGCWWFLNNPSIVREITDERIEMLGTSFIPQHSDARILDQIIYKWKHSRHTIAASLTDSYAALARDGWQPTSDQIKRDVKRLFQGNFRNFAAMPA
ncbi:MAG: glucuronate isomerase [Bryobacteraceae bacterium]